VSRLGIAFAKAKDEGRAALVIYLCAGDPSLAATPALVRAAADAGADVIELGMPWSDPSADGPSIQRASERALRGGANMRGVLEAVRAIRLGGCETPILLFGYYNPILAYGEAALARDAKAAGVDGFLVVDLPPEECAPLRDPVREAGLGYVPLLAPTSDAARAARAAEVAEGFVYYVSMTGVTGSKASDLPSAAKRAGELAAVVGAPVALGFGVKTPDDVRVVAAHADGVVVGSAVVNAAHDAGDIDAACEAVGALVSSFAAATKRA